MVKLAFLLAIGSVALSSVAFAAPRSGGFPQLDIRKTCNSRSQDMDSTAAACMRDETSAKAELRRSWKTIPAATRRTCLDEVRIGGLPSYVELLTCAQMNQWSREEQNSGGAATPPPGRR